MIKYWWMLLLWLPLLYLIFHLNIDWFVDLGETYEDGCIEKEYIVQNSAFFLFFTNVPALFVIYFYVYRGWNAHGVLAKILSILGSVFCICFSIFFFLILPTIIDIISNGCGI